jgi:hypothetical protein
MSRPVVRLAALAGAAAVALGIATPTVAAADERTATVHSIHSTATPIDLAGRTVTVTMPTTHYAVTAAHSGAVVEVAAVGPTAIPATNVTPAYTQNVTPASVSAGAISVGAAATVLFGGLLFIGIKKNEIKKGWAFVAVGFGVFTATTLVGSLYGTVVGTGVSTVSNILGAR